MGFFSELDEAVKKNHSLLCVGLDPDPTLMPPGVSILDFNKAIIDATSNLVCAYKPNLAFYEAEGARGWDTLKQTVDYIPKGILVIADAKRGDIGNTAKAYAKAIFEELGAGGVTINPYLGFDSVEPFLNYKDKGVFILCRTSNAGAADFQSLKVVAEGKAMPLYQAVAKKASEWNKANNIGLVVGATSPDELKLLRQAYPEMPFLIPGVGAQGGDLKLAVQYGIDKRGAGIIINSSRQILYASRGKDFAETARKAALNLRDEINLYRSAS
ncbi:MAG: orotidine-5'-phosphate decarboxylase [Dehalococcoidia bacterium]|nr:MAG: orotidine-5'-phosphate decarboxylase [Dehalococcoidia bacterium]